MGSVTSYRKPQPDRVATSDEFETLAVFRAETPTAQPFQIYVSLLLDSDAGTTGEFRLRSSLDGVLAKTATVDDVTGYSLRFIDWQFISNGEHFFYLEGRRATGSAGGPRVLRAKASLVSAPPGGETTPPTGPADITVVATSETPVGAAATTADIILPAGIDADHQITLHVSTQEDPAAGPPAISSLAGDTYNQFLTVGGDGAFQPEITCFNRTADGTEDGDTITFTWAGAVEAHIVCIVRSGVDPLDPFSGSPSALGTDVDPPAVTTLDDGAEVIAVAAGNATTTPTPTPPTDYAIDFDQTPDARAFVITSMTLATAGTEDPSSYGWTPLDNSSSVTYALKPADSGGGSPSGQTAAPTIPTFDAANAVTITSGQNMASIVSAALPGTHFFVEQGAIINDVALKLDMHVRLAGNKIADGTGIANAAFRAFDANSDNVVIEGDPNSPTRARIENYGNGTTSQRYAAIQGFVSSGGNTDVDGWFIHNLDIADNSSGGVFAGSNFTIHDCEIHGHSVTGIGGDRVVGGLVHSTLLHGNGTGGAGGAFGNAANIKFTMLNADKGRTDIAPVNRPKAPFVVSGCTVEADNRAGGGSALRGVWFDIDCQDVLVEFSEVVDHNNFALLAEGCNNVRFDDNTVRRSNGFGVALSDDFVAGAVIFAESTNCVAARNTLEDCDIAFVNRLSGRPDWVAGGAFPIADPTDGRLYIVPSTTIPAITDQSNYWTGNNTFEDNILVRCNTVMINEGINNANQPTIQGGTQLATIDFTGNDYTASPGIEFFEASLTSLDLTGWQALGRDN